MSMSPFSQYLETCKLKSPQLWNKNSLKIIYSAYFASLIRGLNTQMNALSEDLREMKMSLISEDMFKLYACIVRSRILNFVPESP